MAAPRGGTRPGGGRRCSRGRRYVARRGHAATAPDADTSGSSLSDATFRTFRSPSTGRVGKYHLWASGLDVSRPVGLMLQFHGDGAFEFDNPNSPYSLGGSKGIREQARRHNMILVAVRSPDSGSPAWWRSGETKADYVRDLVEQVVYAHHDIAKDRSWLVGYSGGAEFITRYLLPKYSSLFGGGGAVLFGGGGEPLVSVDSVEPTFAADLPAVLVHGCERRRHLRRQRLRRPQRRARRLVLLPGRRVFPRRSRRRPASATTSPDDSGPSRANASTSVTRADLRSCSSQDRPRVRDHRSGLIASRT